MITALVEIASNFGTTEEIQKNLREYLDQIEQVYIDNKSNEPKK